ncbi:MAG TPA: TRAP transporter substrate-binding protein [Terrimesophilobacter sp.]|nr:TRAP transporter substrate-binding protein [Terrimesophilobacter sp.]HRP98852.1 TRAP transporter substrate-binding protein [Terrimesophilobacter sp.]
MAGVAVGSLALTGCASEGGTGDTPDASPLDFTIASLTAPTVHYGMGIEAMASYIEENSERPATVTHAANATLGGDPQLFEGVQLGSIEIAVVTSSTLGTVNPEWRLLDLPYLFDDPGDLFRVLDGPIGEEMMTKFDGQSFVILGFYNAGIYTLYGDREINSIDDIQGVKTRVRESPLDIATIGAFGANPTPVPWPDVYEALQNGTVNLSNTTVPSLLAASHNEVIASVSKTDHYIGSVAIIANKKWWEGLDEATQGVILAGLAEGKEVDRVQFAAQMDNAFETLEAQGVSITEPDLKPFKAAASEKVWPQFVTDAISKDLVSRIQAESAKQ